MLSCPSPATGGRKRLGPNTVARFIGDILLVACFSETLRRNENTFFLAKNTPGQTCWRAGVVVGPSQVVQEVEEGVPVGLRTGPEDRYHGREAGLFLLDVCS